MRNTTIHAMLHLTHFQFECLFWKKRQDTEKCNFSAASPGIAVVLAVLARLDFARAVPIAR